MTSSPSSKTSSSNATPLGSFEVQAASMPRTTVIVERSLLPLADVEGAALGKHRVGIGFPRLGRSDAPLLTSSYVAMMSHRLDERDARPRDLRFENGN